MSGGVEVDPVEVRAAADWFDGAAGELSDRVDGHMRAVREFLGAEWVGVAAGSHEEPWGEWEGGARRIIASFRADAGVLRQAGEEFATNDRCRAEATERLDLPEVM
ncbi:WXG100 family type VII secretion target [Nocardia sp. NBC_01503]|uniref:WXG100 family type VII secretion target n=1 Tax=Nocardia sp. NBC_01503 TaxID=2975997 RepID=UPI002E7C453D|nr:WXG100 family type VII secretion target [Nocardia sp. NBC_01503]WTL32713.1 WXG100 family type VII secretion target [Nocardia sp. NBC_01503]